MDVCAANARSSHQRIRRRPLFLECPWIKASYRIPPGRSERLLRSAAWSYNSTWGRFLQNQGSRGSRLSRSLGGRSTLRHPPRPNWMVSASPCIPPHSSWRLGNGKQQGSPLRATRKLLAQFESPSRGSHRRSNLTHRSQSPARRCEDSSG